MNRFLFVCATVFSLVALAWGITVVGGPGYARMEKNDRQRVQDIKALAQHHRCVEQSALDTKDGLSPARCSATETRVEALQDPSTGEDYAYDKASNDRFSVCATFEIGKEAMVGRQVNNVVFEGKRGCIFYRRSGKNWAITG